MPISSAVDALLNGELAVADIVPSLMRRSPKVKLRGMDVWSPRAT